MVELALLFYVLYLIFERHNTPYGNKLFWEEHSYIFKSGIFWTVTIFIAVFSLSAFAGVDFKTSFWANFERGEGVFQFLHYYLFFLVSLLALKTESDWKRLFLFSIFAGIALNLYGYAQILGVEGVVSSGQGRMQGTLGNPAYVGAYLMFGMFYAAYLFISEKNKGLKVFLGLTFIMFVAGFLFAQTRGSLLGLIAGVFLGILYLIWKSPSGQFRKISLYVFLGLVLAGSLIFYFKDTPLIKNLPFSRIFEISLSESGAQTRFWTWGSAVKGFYERPVLGWGPENFSRVFDRYFDIRHFISPKAQGQQLWFDRAHNNFFEYLVQSGLVGLLSYLAIFLIFYLKVFKDNIWKKENNFSDPLKNALLIFMPIAYFVQGLILFDVLPIFINVSLFFAFALYKFHHDEAVIQNNLNSKKKQVYLHPTNLRYALILIVVAIPVILYYGSYLPLKKGQALINAMQNSSSVDSLAKFQSVWKSALDLKSPVGEEETLKQLGTFSFEVVSKRKVPVEVVRELLGFVDSYMKPAIERGSGSGFVQFHYILGTLYQRVGLQYQLSEYVDKAEKIFKDGIAIGETRPQFWYGLLDIYTQTGRTKEGEEVHNKILSYWPRGLE